MNTETSTKDFMKGIAKNAFEGFMIGSGMTFWTFYILGRLANIGKEK